MMRMRCIRGLSLLLILVYGSALADKRTEFRQAYEQYQSAVAGGDKAVALGAAREAYRLGLKIYGKDSMNVVRLSLNYAGLLNDTGDFRNARKVLKKKLNIIEDAGGDASDLELVLYELGRAEFDWANPKRGLAYFDRSVQSVSEADVGRRATRSFSIGSHLLKQQGDRHTKPYFETAHQGFKEILQPHDIRLGLASYHRGLWAYREKRLDDAVAFLDEALIAFSSESEPMTDFERPVRQMLITLHEGAGASDLATPHVLAFGRAQDWQRRPDPLYMDTTPTMMMAKSGIQGDVGLLFGIDEMGNVTDLSVANSTNFELNDLATEVMSTARFAPQFQGDVPVETQNVSYTLTFDFTVPQQTPKLGGMPESRGFPDEGGYRSGQSEEFIGSGPQAIGGKSGGK